jgi:hypothetical protein
VKVKVTFECEVFPWVGPPQSVVEEVLHNPLLAYVKNVEVEEKEDEEDE